MAKPTWNVRWFLVVCFLAVFFVLAVRGSHGNDDLDHLGVQRSEHMPEATHPGDTTVLHGSGGGASTSRSGRSVHRVVKESVLPARKKTHIATVDVDALVAGVEGEGYGAGGHTDVGTVVRRVKWVWSPRYVRVRCEDGDGVWVGVRVYNSVGRDGGNGGGDGDGKKKMVWCGWSYAVHYHVDNVGRRHGNGAGSGRVGGPNRDIHEDDAGAPWCWVALSDKGLGVLTIEAEGNASSATRTFIVEYVHELSWVRVALYVLGAVLFVYAPFLARSMAFRLTAGSCGCIALSAILVAFVVWRNVPYKKSLAAVLAMWGGAAAVLWKLVSTVHSSAFDRGRAVDFLFHPLLLGYVVASGLVGLAVTYYTHDARNEKMNTIVQVGLQLAGVGLMVGSGTSWIGGAVWGGMVVVWNLFGVGWKIKKTRNGAGARGKAGWDERPRERRAVGVRGDLHVQLPESPSSESGGGGVDYAHDEQPPRSPPLTPTVFRVSTTRGVPPSPADFPEAERGRLHGLVRRGKILNVETDRTIAIGKTKYNELYLRGYEVNFESGEITPPTSRPSQGFR